MPNARGHSWRFKTRFRRHAFGWKSQPAITRLQEALAAIKQVAGYWGELCGSRELASEWADRLINITRLALSPDKSTRGYFHGTSACLSALFTAGRYDELIELVRNDVLWSS